MASTPNHRRPLATLNSNHALTPQRLRTQFPTCKSTSNSVFMEEALPSKTLGGKVLGEVDNEGRWDGGKRNVTDDDYDVRANKRQRKNTIVEEASVQEHDQSQSRKVAGTLEEDELSGDHVERNFELEEAGASLLGLMSPSSEVSSPAPSDASSLASPMAAVNESQNTTITVPDEDIPTIWPTSSQSSITPARSPLTAIEIRQKAKDLRLRLSLANYKVRTNQIDVPISRLQIRSSALPSRISLSGALRTSRTPLPSTIVPYINLQKPLEKSHISLLSVPSSPSGSNVRTAPSSRLASPVKQRDVVADRLSTPLLPRQREGLLNPPLLDSPEERHLISSVVKGRAADGLLSLMRHQE